MSLNDQQEEIIPAIRALTDEGRAELYRAVKSTEAAYAVAPESRTEAERILVQEHEDWKTKENHE
jgi:hypothetical protein